MPNKANERAEKVGKVPWQRRLQQRDPSASTAAQAEGIIPAKNSGFKVLL
jgi:hypothetical protein